VPTQNNNFRSLRMFSLIIVTIAITLVAALAAATLYYGGNAYEEQRVKADAARLVNEGMQVKAAAEYHRVQQGALPSSIEQMVEGEYLKAGLADSAWSTSNGYALVTNVPENRCLMANQQLGIDNIPSCDDPGYSNKPVCCSTAEPATP
jgi:hypothetical protein